MISEYIPYAVILMEAITIKVAEKRTAMILTLFAIASAVMFFI